MNEYEDSESEDSASAWLDSDLTDSDPIEGMSGIGKPNNGGGLQGNNGYGNGDLNAPGGSGGNNNAENALITQLLGMTNLQPTESVGAPKP